MTSQNKAKIALVYELRSAYRALGYTETQCKKFVVGSAAEFIAGALREHGHEVVLIPDHKSLISRLVAGEGETWDMVFNTTEGVYGMAREAQVPALLETFQIPFTFSNAATMALCLDKAKTKMVLEYYGVPTAPFAVIQPSREKNLTPERVQTLLQRSPHAKSLNYPLFAKPVAEGSSDGIVGSNKANDPVELCDIIAKTCAASPTCPDVIIESFLPGKEYTIAIMGTGDDAWVLGADEFIWREANPGAVVVNGLDGSSDPLLPFMTKNCKVSIALGGGQGVAQVKADMARPEVQRACQVALDAWKVLGCYDCGRVDVRLDSTCVPCVMEINPLAGLHPQKSELAAIARNQGLAYDDLMEMIVQIALKRYGLGDCRKGVAQVPGQGSSRL
ncbi:hypothetical protein BDV25DRAFT_126347 [Aspergillus avenaceus]|uniref:ATP-grasp domain-containing protein n=1 Tax=Aspergillus avenaceus TaxID=36643 RepID=A0A5N6U8E2_ASPAV|nr:hypothetical protein BDV25DRAFT_126347 [Aspergillus avenaceus]